MYGFCGFVKTVAFPYTGFQSSYTGFQSHKIPTPSHKIPSRKPQNPSVFFFFFFFLSVVSFICFVFFFCWSMEALFNLISPLAQRWLDLGEMKEKRENAKDHGFEAREHARFELDRAKEENKEVRKAARLQPDKEQTRAMDRKEAQSEHGREEDERKEAWE